MSSVPGLNVVIDLSHYNPVTSFQEVQQAGIVGVIHKATEGTNWTDSTYAGRKPQALAAGLWWGAYHFGTDSDGVKQAINFLNVVGDASGTLIALDFESNPTGSSMSLEEARFHHSGQARYGPLPGLLLRP